MKLESSILKLKKLNRLLQHICLVILLVAWPSAWAQPIDWPAPPERTVWLAAAHESFGDGQTAAKPIDASTAVKLGQALDRLAKEHGFYGDGLVLRFLPGEYETHGIRLRPRWHITGDGIGRTTIKLVPSARHRKIKSAYHSVISGGWGPQRLAKRDFNNIRIADVSLDCNWRGMKKVLGPILKKVAGVDLLVRQALVERVQVSRFGAVGGRPEHRGAVAGEDEEGERAARPGQDDVGGGAARHAHLEAVLPKEVRLGRRLGDGRYESQARHRPI